MTFGLVLLAPAIALYWHYFMISGNPQKPVVMSLHMSAGLLLWLLTILRLIARFSSALPPPVPLPRVMAMTEKIVQFLLYLGLIVVPLIGLASAWFRGRPFDFLGMFPIPSPLVTEWASPTGKLLERVHIYGAYIFLALASLHVLAALYHHKIRRDQILARMLPSGQ
jgi:cytochrome b561